MSHSGNLWFGASHAFMHTYKVNLAITHFTTTAHGMRIIKNNRRSDAVMLNKRSGADDD